MVSIGVLFLVGSMLDCIFTLRYVQVLKVCLNHLLTPEHQFCKKDDRTVTWSATDFSDDVACPYQFALRLKTSQVAEEFLAAVEEAKSKSSGSVPPCVSIYFLYSHPFDTALTYTIFTLF